MYKITMKEHRNRYIIELHEKDNNVIMELLNTDNQIVAAHRFYMITRFIKDQDFRQKYTFGTTVIFEPAFTLGFKQTDGEVLCDALHVIRN